MQKDFKTWHELKERIDDDLTYPLFREMEVWWCALGANVGIEEDGKNELFERPVFIFRKFNKEMFWGLPMSSNNKQSIFHYTFLFQEKPTTILLSQIRIWSSKRLIRRISKVSDNQFFQINKAFLNLINETDPFRGPRVPNGNSSTIITSE
jgi:mRNA interferase MazF